MYIYSPNKRIFKGHSGVGGLDLSCLAKICARKMASVASRGLQGPPTTTTPAPHIAGIVRGMLQRRLASNI